MPKRSSKRPEDENQAAKRIADRLAELSGEKPEPEPPPEPPPPKNPAAVALGKLGGVKGGPARAKKLSAKRRAEIARRAAKARWERNRE